MINITQQECQREPNQFTLHTDERWFARIQINGELTVEQQREHMRHLAASWNACLGLDIACLEENGAAGMSDLVAMAREIAELRAHVRVLTDTNEAFGKRQEWWNEKMLQLEGERNALQAKLDALEKQEPVSIRHWQDELLANHPNSDRQYWPDELMFKYARREINAYRAHPLYASPKAQEPVAQGFKVAHVLDDTPDDDFGNPIVYNTNEIDQITHSLTGYEGEEDAVTVLRGLVSYLGVVHPNKTMSQVLVETEEALAAPKVQEPLTDDEMARLYRKSGLQDRIFLRSDWEQGVRDGEAAHGIGSQQ